MFTFEDQEIVKKAFLIALDRTLTRYIDPINRNSIQAFLLETAHLRNPITVLSNEGLDDLTHQIFTNGLLSEFVFALSFTFYTAWGESSSKLDGLIQSLTNGLTVSTERGSLIPKEITNRYRSGGTIQSLLVANTWLIPLLLVMTYYRESDRNPK